MGLAVVGSVRSPTWAGGLRSDRSGTTGIAAWAAASEPRRTSAERTPPRISPSRSSEATVPAGRKSSMYGYGGAHPAGERLVAGRAGQRVEPDQPMAVASQSGGLGGDERGVAAIPAVVTRR